MFYADPHQSTRARNYYSPDIYIPMVNLDWRIGARTKLTWLTSAVLGSRSSVKGCGLPMEDRWLLHWVFRFEIQFVGTRDASRLNKYILTIIQNHFLHNIKCSLF
jgi:hypothetical protein